MQHRPKHRAHKVDLYAHPAYRQRCTYSVNGRIHKFVGRVDNYTPAHRGLPDRNFDL